MDSSNSSAYPKPGSSTDPHVVWASLSRFVAQRPFVRESHDRRSFPARWQRRLTDRLPVYPAAVPVYSTAGDTRVLVVDLDTHRHSQGDVDRDAAEVEAFVRLCGGAVVMDQSPTGGIHVYIPLAHAVPFDQARLWALALASRLPTMDATPMLNVSDGLIRPPGAAHHAGGHQTLRNMSLTRAYELLRDGNPGAVWEAMRTRLAPEIHALSQPASPVSADGAPEVTRAAGSRPLPADYAAIARTGMYDTGRYASPSEARLAVITAAAWAGHTLTQVLGRIHGGVWPGLASFYARYRNPATRTARIRADWDKACTSIRAARDHQRPRDKPVRKSPTSEPVTHRPAPPPARKSLDTTGEHQFLRTWWSALALLQSRYHSRAGMGSQLVLRALAEAAQKSGSRYVAFGTRSLEIACGMDHTTVAAHLRDLREEQDPLVVLIENERGERGDLYELVIPASVEQEAKRRRWRAGKMRALRPVFRELGVPAAFVYESLEIASGRALTTFEIAADTGLGRSTVHDAIATLAAFNLVKRSPRGWVIVASTCLTRLAETLGCLDHIQAQIQRHRRERVQYRAALRRFHTDLETFTTWHELEELLAHESPHDAAPPSLLRL